VVVVVAAAVEKKEDVLGEISKERATACETAGRDARSSVEDARGRRVLEALRNMVKKE
jgi:hypothetical protein